MFTQECLLRNVGEEGFDLDEKLIKKTQDL
jgi:hypothetical protein